MGACEVVQNATAQTWAALAGSSSPSDDQGSYSVSVSSLGQEITNPEGGPGNVFLIVHGSINCTMPAFTVTGASGTVTLAATF
ncbi:MAG TPA: hypothetical protein VKZ18_27820 [Polyangia bacterium]|nr:hypothetical protein [Polyangia bacterium]